MCTKLELRVEPHWHVLPSKVFAISDKFFIFSPDDLAYPENRTLPSLSASRLSYSSCGSGSAWGPRCSSSSYLPGPDDSEGDDDRCQPYPLYQSHLGHLSHTSQESLNSPNPPPQVFNIIHIHICQSSYKILITLYWLDAHEFRFSRENTWTHQ